MIVEARKVWKEMVTRDLIIKLADTMPDRIRAVLENKGGPTKY